MAPPSFGCGFHNIVIDSHWEPPLPNDMSYGKRRAIRRPLPESLNSNYKVGATMIAKNTLLSRKLQRKGLLLTISGRPNTKKKGERKVK